MQRRIIELSGIIGARLLERGQSIAVAESLTAGKLQDAIASVSGSSGYFRGGVTTYCIDTKVSLLQVGRTLAEQCNCVSGPIAAQMAKGVKDLFKTDVGAATTGYAEPWGNVTVPYAHYAVCYGGVLSTGRAEADPGMSREDMRQMITLKVLNRIIMATWQLASE